jgi:hypothetical protein
MHIRRLLINQIKDLNSFRVEVEAIVIFQIIMKKIKMISHSLPMREDALDKEESTQMALLKITTLKKVYSI